jgi:hypothetical protein
MNGSMRRFLIWKRRDYDSLFPTGAFEGKIPGGSLSSGMIRVASGQEANRKSFLQSIRC